MWQNLIAIFIATILMVVGVEALASVMAIQFISPEKLKEMGIIIFPNYDLGGSFKFSFENLSTTIFSLK